MSPFPGFLNKIITRYIFCTHTYDCYREKSELSSPNQISSQLDSYINMRKSIISSVLISLLLLTWAFARYTDGTDKGKKVVFDTSVAEDASPHVLARILQAEEKPISEIKFEKGTYHFYPDKAFEAFCNISNHDDVLARTAFPLFNMKNLTIDGQGSTFIFHGRMIPFLIDNCENIKLTNLSIDWDVPFHSEGLIVARDEEKGTFDLEISDDYPYEIRNGQLIFVKPYYEHTLGQTILYDPERKAIAFDTESYTSLTTQIKSDVRADLKKITYKYKIDTRSPANAGLGKEDRLRAEELSPGLVRIHNHAKKMPPVGMILSAKGSKGQNRIAPAIRITATKGFDALHVTVHHAGGMGLIAENSANLTLDDFNVTPSHGRMVSTTADATHFVGCRGKVILRNCTFNNQLDDASNFHGSYQEVIDILGKNKIGVRMGHFQQQGFPIGFANDTIGLVRLAESFFPYDKLTIKSLERVNGRYQILTFNESIPESLQTGDLIENLDAYPEVLVQNCNISQNRARGLLISTPKKVVIENNFFHTEMEALLIPVESSHWYESGNASDLTITNNVFQDCQHSGFNRGVIRFVTDDDNDNIAFKQINITDNKFNHFDNLVLEVSNSNGVNFSGNTITKTETFPQLHPENPAIKIKSSKHIRFENNTYNGKAKAILKTDSALSNLIFQ